MMKKFSIMLSIILVFVVVFASCNKDDDNNTSQNQIVGKWKIATVNETENGKLVASTDDIIGYVLEFNSNLSYTASYQNMLFETGTYVINGGSISLINGDKTHSGSAIPDDDNDCSLGTYSISEDNELHLYYQFSEETIIYIREIVAIRIK